MKEHLIKIQKKNKKKESPWIDYTGVEISKIYKRNKNKLINYLQQQALFLQVISEFLKIKWFLLFYLILLYKKREGICIYK